MNTTLSIANITFLSTDLNISKSPFYKHKDAELILEKAKTTSSLLGIVDEALYGDHTTMTNYLYVNGLTQKMVNVLVTYDTLYFLDDFFGEDTVKEDVACLKTILALWEGKTIKLTVKNDKLKKLYQAIKYIGEVIKEDSSIHFFKKYTASVKEHLYYALESPPYKTVNEYVKTRLYTSGMIPVIDLIEYVNDNYIPEKLERKLTLLQKLKETCALIGGLSNDLFSYGKEKHSDFNLINAFLLTKEANTYEEAVSKSITLVNKLSEDFEQDLIQIRNEIQSLDYMDKSIIENHLKGLEIIISACYHWQFETKRYKHPEAVFEDIKRN